MFCRRLDAKQTCLREETTGKQTAVGRCATHRLTMWLGLLSGLAVERLENGGREEDHPEVITVCVCVRV